MGLEHLKTGWVAILLFFLELNVYRLGTIAVGKIDTLLLSKAVELSKGTDKTFWYYQCPQNKLPYLRLFELLTTPGCCFKPKCILDSISDFSV